MCLVTIQIKPKIMKKDLIVWKEIRVDYEDKNTVYSIYYQFKWVRGVLYEKDIIKTRCCLWGQAEKYDYDVILAYPNITGKFTEVSEGFHACKQRGRATAYYKFLIPKGALYFEDKSRLIVSNKMMWL